MARIPCLPRGLCCPECHEPTPGDAVASCVRCGKPAILRGGCLPDFIGGDGRLAQEILSWPDGLVDYIELWVRSIRSGCSPEPSVAAELKTRGLADQGSRPTELGQKLFYHVREFNRQAENPQFQPFLEHTGLGPDARVLDVGCGAGQTLRLIKSFGPAERIGLDLDLESLAFGVRVAEVKHDAIGFVRATAHAVPFADGRFTHVLCRVGLNYMHQERALREMVRVLEPGGYLYCVVEGLGFDLKLLGRMRNPRQLASRLYDLGAGLILALTGWQPIPGGKSRVGRLFASRRRIAKTLGRLDCPIVGTEVTSFSRGVRNGYHLLARRQT
jgi:SAM-dependent methyltransferase